MNINRRLLASLLPLAVCLLLPALPAAAETAREQSFDTQWRFLRGDAPGAEAPDFSDAAWRVLEVPHDWSIEDLPPDAGTNAPGSRVGPFDPASSPGGASTGHVLGGTGWYRKHFVLGPAAGERKISVRFDGVYMNADFWLNGHHLGNHPYGYTSFSFDLTPWLRPPGETNVLAVRVRNLGKNSRWYSGSGIYRHVTLVNTDPLHIAEYGLTAGLLPGGLEKTGAHTSVAAEIWNESADTNTVTVRYRVLNPRGITSAERESQHRLSPGEHLAAIQDLLVPNPEPWSPSSPALYRAEVDVVANGRIVDSARVAFGLRQIEVDATNGFRLNGESLKLKGGCLHHDNGPLGSAAIDRAEERRVELMKAYGFNAIRTSHNPPSPAFLDACDRLGMLVIDEAFDCWEQGKNPEDYHVYFKEWSDRDIASMVRRDRNHPSVVFWSIGNEITERFDRPDIAKRLREDVLRQDTTRPITEAVNPTWEPQNQKRDWDKDSDVAFRYLDVGGYNYQPQKFESDHARNPARIMMTTESFPKDLFDYWTPVENHPYVIGDFVWTGMDYFGESGIGHTSLDNEKDDFLKPWPWYNAWCGDIDVCGFKKPQSYYRDVVWRRTPIAMAVHAPIPEGRKEVVSAWGWPDERQCWTWPGQEGKPLTVSVYARGDTVRLELNGKLIGEQPVSETNKLTAKFEVPYAPGELRATVLVAGKPAGRALFHTTGAPAGLRLTADRSVIRADRNDLAYVTVEVVDKAGNVVPNAAVPVRFTVSGAGTLAATGSSNPSDASSFHTPRRTTFDGRCLAILRPNGAEGKLTLRAEADGLASASTTVQLRPAQAGP